MMTGTNNVSGRLQTLGLACLIVMVHITKVLRVDSEIFLADTRHREPELDVLRCTRAVDDDARPKDAHGFDETPRLRRICRLDLSKQIEGRSNAALVSLIHRERDELSNTVTNHGQPHSTVESSA